MQSRLIALEKKIDVITKLLETLASNLLLTEVKIQEQDFRMAHDSDIRIQ